MVHPSYEKPETSEIRVIGCECDTKSLPTLSIRANWTSMSNSNDADGYSCGNEYNLADE